MDDIFLRSDNEVVVVYRLLRSEEEWINGLHRQDGFDTNISAMHHIESGSHHRPSRFISASKSRDVCLFYASKSIYERGTRLGDLRIARIKLRLDHSVWDVSTNRILRREMGIDHGSTADNYARVFQEVLIERSIAVSEISSVEQVPNGLPEARKFRDFKSEREGVALAQALASLQI